MLRISRLSDYAVVLATHLAGRPAGAVASVRGLADETGIPRPTASKILKRLARSGVVSSVRGVNGGYRLARAPGDISVSDVLAAIEGPVEVTECGTGACGIEGRCEVRHNWMRISEAVRSALAGITLAEMARPITVVRLGRRPGAAIGD